MRRLLIGTAGIPHSAPSRSSEEGITRLAELGLGAMELEFVRGVRMSPARALKVGTAAKKKGIVLTAHAPYYINLNSPEMSKVTASRKRIVDTASLCALAGGYSITFHAGYYLGLPSDAVYRRIKAELLKVIRTLKDMGVDIWIRPETTGKPTQWGSLNEIIRLSSEVEGIMPTIDFSHLHARSAGAVNTADEFRKVLETVESYLGREGLENLHCHLSGIEYNASGEMRHLILRNSDMNYRALLDTLAEFRACGVLICESPNLEGDAMLLKMYWYNKSGSSNIV